MSGAAVTLLLVLFVWCIYATPDSVDIEVHVADHWGDVSIDSDSIMMTLNLHVERNFGPHRDFELEVYAADADDARSKPYLVHSSIMHTTQKTAQIRFKLDAGRSHRLRVDANGHRDHDSRYLIRKGDKEYDLMTPMQHMVYRQRLAREADDEYL